jgi:hypothetical protein
MSDFFPLYSMQHITSTSAICLLGAFAKLRKLLLASSCLHVRPSAWDNSALTGRIFMRFDVYVFLETLSKKFKFHYSIHKMYIFFIVSRSLLLRMKNVLEENCWENRNTRFMFSNTIFFSEILLQIRNVDSLLHSSYPAHLAVIELLAQLTISLYESWGAHSGVIEDSGHMRCDGVWLHKPFPTFRRYVLPLSSWG